MAMADYRKTMWLLPIVLLSLQMVQTVIPNACNNENCEQFCKTEDEGVICSCAAGYALGYDNKTCVPVGTVDKEKEEPSRVMHRVEKIIAHAEFDTETFNSDIALLKLEESITFSEYVVPACLPEEDFANGVLMDQTFGIVSGFGNTFERAQPVKRMKALQIPYVDRDTCKFNLRSPVTENIFFAGYDKDGEGVCQGDGGDPHVTKYNGTYFVTGIINWGEECGRRGKCGVYTNLSKFLPWVRSVLTENS